MKPVTLKHYFNTRNIALVGILAAIIFVLTKFISIPQASREAEPCQPACRGGKYR